MVKKAKEGRDASADAAKGCVCPLASGCRVRRPIDPLDPPPDAVRIVCSNGDKCKQVPYVHAACFDQWNEELLKDYKALGNRARNDARMVRYYAVNADHLWGTQAYGKLARFCKCPCGGTLRKYLQIENLKPVENPPPPRAAQPPVAQASAFTKKAPKKPPLVTNKKSKGPCNMVYKSLLGSSYGRNRGADGDRTKEKRPVDSYIPGLYAGDVNSTRKVDTSVSVPPLRPAAPPLNKPKQAPNQLIDSIGTENELIDQLNELFDLVPDDISQEQLSDLVHQVLGRVDIALLSVITDSGGIWEWLRAKDQVSQSSDDEEESPEYAELLADAKESVCFKETPLAYADVDKDHSADFRYMAAFCYRDSLMHVESLMKMLSK